MNKILLFFCISISIWGCNRTPSTTEPSKGKVDNVGSVYYDVLIKSDKPTDDWEQIAIEKLDRKKLVAHLFKQIVDQKLRLEDFYEEKEISLSTFKKRVETGEIDPDKITKLQFEEVWETSTIPLNKKIKSIVFAVNSYDHLGKKIGYRPIFICYYP